MFTQDKVTEFFFVADEFYPLYSVEIKKRQVGHIEGLCKRAYHRDGEDVHPRGHEKNKRFVEVLSGKLFADRGYVSKSLFATLFADGIHIVTRLKKGMKGGLRSVADMVLLRKRAIIETVNDELKNIAQIEHSRHRSVMGFMVNALAALSTYCFSPKKPSIMVDFCNGQNDRQLSLF